MKPLTVVLAGAESTGKTTLAAQLAAALEAPWVEEFAREYLRPGAGYDAGDVLAIARGQHAAEEQALTTEPTLLVMDTDLLVTRIWSEVRFGRVDPWILDRLTEVNARARRRLYLLPIPDIPWTPDPLRESPHARDVLHARYREVLEEMAAEFVELGGTEEARLDVALAHVRAAIRR